MAPAKTKSIASRRFWRTFGHYCLIVLGCFLLAFGDAIFLDPLNLITGGIFSIGMIINYWLSPLLNGFKVTDIVAWVLQIIFLVLGVIFLGKRFALRTVVASLIYPLFLTLIMRTGMGNFIIEQLTAKLSVVDSTGKVIGMADNTALAILTGIFGGAFVGAGVACTYLGDGSTGGLDVLCVIIARHTPVKEALSSFILDGSIVLIGMFVFRDIPNGLIGILSALVCAMVVQFIYVDANSYVIADVVSDHYEEIMEYVHKEMDHGSTVIDATGGYSQEPKKLLRVAFNRRELSAFKNYIALVDPKAFVTFTQAKLINGEGFEPLPIKKNDEDAALSDRVNSHPLSHQIDENEKDKKDD